MSEDKTMNIQRDREQIRNLRINEILNIEGKTFKIVFMAVI